MFCLHRSGCQLLRHFLNQWLWSFVEPLDKNKDKINFPSTKHRCRLWDNELRFVYL